MVATMNTLGLDYMTFGNHEFDLSETTLLTRMNESNFTWISSNVFRINTSQPFGSSITHKIITINNVRILIITFTIEGTNNYTKQFLSTFPNEIYDVLVADILQIDLIMGGHEHENYYNMRGADYTPIHKADGNASTVYIHRCAFNIDTRRFRIYSTLAPVTFEVPEEEKTATVVKYWYDLGIAGFQLLGYKPSEVISCLLDGIELDNRSDSVRNSQTLLSSAIYESMINTTLSSGTTIAVFNSVLAQVLTTRMATKGGGRYLAYSGVQTLNRGSTWLDKNGTDITTSSTNYTVATVEYVKSNIHLETADIIQRVNKT